MVEWTTTPGLTPYPDACAAMEARVEKIVQARAPEQIWLVEHPPMYTAGASAKSEDLRAPLFPVHHTRRGGQYTYHGPGQRVVYVLMDLNTRGRDVRRFVSGLETWVIEALNTFQVRGTVRSGRVGVWVERPQKPPLPNGDPAEDKIAAIGVRVRRWVTYHGLSINVDPDLTHYRGIVPCGIEGHGVTSLVDLGLPVTMADVDVALRRTLPSVLSLR